MKESIAHVVNDDGRDVISNLFHDLDASPAEETASLEFDGNKVVLDTGEDNEVDVTEDDLSDGDGIVAVDNNSDTRSVGQAVGTAMGCDEDLNTLVITIHRSPFTNELLGHQDNANIIMKEFSEIQNKRLKYIEDGNEKKSQKTHLMTLQWKHVMW